MSGYAQKWVRPFRSYGTLKSGASHKWFDESSRLIEWFLYGDSDWIIFGLTTSLLCIFEICWVSTAVALVKNDVLLLVPTGKVLELSFPKNFLIKAWLSVEKLFPICFVHFMPMSHGFIKKVPQPPSNRSPSLFCKLPS